MKSDTKVLVVDDDPGVREGLETAFLSMWECEVFVAEDGKEALRAIEEATFDLVVTDFRMPGASGLEVAKRAKEKSSNTGVILITGKNDKATIEKMVARSTVVDRPLFKPVGLAELKRAVEAIRKNIRVKA